MPEASLKLWSRLTTRLVVALCGLALLFTIVGVAQPVTATGLSAQISAARRSQLYYESTMRTQDQILSRLKRQAKTSNNGIKQAKRSIKRSAKALVAARKVIAERSARLARLEARYADPSLAPDPANYKARVKALKKELAGAKRRRKSIGAHQRAMIRARKYRQQRLSAVKRQKRPTVARREAAEGGLASQIVHMTRLAHSRAENQTGVHIAAGSTFEWPSAGRIVQSYGCTGFRLLPRRGSCAHFHDGLDIVSGYGSAVRAAAVGVVAYAGWNPWDEHGRAWMIVVSHPDGYVTRYGHLVPTSRVRVGQLVRKGQAIGKMGNTGMSTGTHLHFELLRGTTTLNPLGYLPSGVFKFKKSKPNKKNAKNKKGAKKGKKSAKRFKAAKRARAKRAESRKAAVDGRDAGSDTPGAFDLSAIARATSAGGSDPDPPTDEDEGVPLPMRGTSAVPA